MDRQLRKSLTYEIVIYFKFYLFLTSLLVVNEWMKIDENNNNPITRRIKAVVIQ